MAFQRIDEIVHMSVIAFIGFQFPNELLVEAYELLSLEFVVLSFFNELLLVLLVLLHA